MDPVQIATIALQLVKLLCDTFKVEVPTDEDWAVAKARVQTPFGTGLSDEAKAALDLLK